MKKIYIKNLFLLFIFSILIVSVSLAQNTLSWRKSYAPHSRNVNAVKVLDINTIIMVGGNESNAALSSIFRSIDRGNIWNVIYDESSAWLLDISFPNPNIGYVVGWDGKIFKSTDKGLTWTPKPSTGNVSNRNFNGVFFVTDQIGYVVGGNKSMDSIQTILKTTDGGNSWAVQRDNLGTWLKAVYFTDANNGVAVGDNGVILRTTNGGSNWNVISVSGGAGTRNYSKVYFKTATEGYIVGGNTSNDSIRTILKTTDGGASWNILQDNLADKANAIDFATSTNGIIVGDRGNIISSTDGGNTWNTLAVPDSINNADDLSSVDFLNIDFGVAAGKFGKVLIYENNIPLAPVCNTGNSLISNNNSVKIFADVNASGSLSTFVFEYGTTPSLGSTISANPSSFNSNVFTNVSATLSSLSDGLYYYRIKGTNLGGDSYGAIKQFYVGTNPIPNFDFELWRTDTTETLEYLTVLNKVEKGNSYDGSQSAIIKSSSSSAVSAIIAGLIGDNGPQGGFPFTERADSLVVHLKYNLVSGYDGLVLLFFKKNGAVISQNIYNLQDSTNGQFIRSSFPISYQDTSAIPDTVILGFVNANPFAQLENPNNVIEVDNVSFIGTSQNIPNADMESWDEVIAEKPLSWTTYDDKEGSPSNDYVKKTTNAAIHDYAVKILSDANTQRLGYIMTRQVSNNRSDIPSFPVSNKFNTLTGYYKFYKEGNDTAVISVFMYNNGQNIGYGRLLLGERDTNYTVFVDSINYSQNLVPDSAFINIQYKKDNPNAGPNSNSVLYIDALSFDNIIDTVEIPTALKNNIYSIKSLKLYPNPTKDFIALELPEIENLKSIEIFDLNGRTVYAEPINNQFDKVRMFNVSTLQNGIYFVRVQFDSSTYINKFIVER